MRSLFMLCDTEDNFEFCLFMCDYGYSYMLMFEVFIILSIIMFSVCIFENAELYIVSEFFKINYTYYI